jgi:hypothetical protein
MRPQSSTGYTFGERLNTDTDYTFGERLNTDTDYTFGERLNTDTDYTFGERLNTDTDYTFGEPPRPAGRHAEAVARIRCLNCASTDGAEISPSPVAGGVASRAWICASRSRWR